jgi:hypothetical protein
MAAIMRIRPPQRQPLENVNRETRRTRSSALVPLQSPPEQTSHPTTEIFQQTIRATLRYAPTGTEKQFPIPLFLRMGSTFVTIRPKVIAIRGVRGSLGTRVLPAGSTSSRSRGRFPGAGRMIPSSHETM